LNLTPSLALHAVETPGHKADHMSYLLKSQTNHKLLFPGDAILGTPSTSFDCLISYMKSLDKMQKLNPDEIILSHHTNEWLIPDAKSKIESYIRYRKARE
jgi:glyoxylase-like metal-dependent hydrolase (beta-lactamase superfamily II)